MLHSNLVETVSKKIPKGKTSEKKYAARKREHVEEGEKHDFQLYSFKSGGDGFYKHGLRAAVFS